MKNTYINYLKKAAVLLIVAFMIIPGTVSADTSSNNMEISCTYPGKIVEAGETVIFELDITNNAGIYSKKIRADTFKGEDDWKIYFYAGDDEIDRVAMNEGQDITLTMVVDTAGDTPIDTYPIRVAIDDASMWLYIIIDETHAGEMGILKAEVVDEQGEYIEEAVISIYKTNTDNFVTSVLTTSDGQIRTEIDQGDYDLVIEREGYRSNTLDDISVKSGYLEDVGTIMLEKKTYGVLIDFKSPIISAASDENPIFEATITNVGKSDDILDLGTSDTPSGWYFRYKESNDASAGISRIYIESGGEKTVYLEAIAPNTVETGDYTFNSAIKSSDYLYEEPLEVRISGTSNMVVFSEKYKYDITKGDILEIPVQITNNGNGETLTNINTEVTAPDGWSVQISPETIASIEPGEKETVTLTVVPPSNIAASEYKISLNVVSDEESESDDIRIIVTENSIVGILGLILLILVAGGVFYFFRKHARR